MYQVDDNPPFMPPPLGASNGGQPGESYVPRAAIPPSPSYWPAQGTPYPSSAPGPTGWPTTPSPPNSYPAVYPVSAPAWAHPGAQAAPQTRGGYIPWVGGAAPSSSSGYSPWTAPAGSWGTPNSGTYEPAYIQTAPATYYPTQCEVDANGFPINRLGRSHSKHDDRKRSQSGHRRNSSSNANRPRFDLTINTEHEDRSGATSDWVRESAFAGALRRSNSQGNRYTTPHYRDAPQHMNRSISWGNEPIPPTSSGPFYPPPSSAWDSPNTLSVSAPAQDYLPPYLQGDVYDEKNLAKRPRDWRADYVPRQTLTAGLANLVLGKGKSDVREFSDPIKRTLTAHLLHTSQPPIHLNLLQTPFHPSQITSFLSSHSSSIPPLTHSLSSPALTPPTSTLRLIHPRLPWPIDISTPSPHGLTLHDILLQTHRQLHTPILGRHFWNDELGYEERGEITRAFVRRCGGDVERVRRGVVQLDFLGDRVVFEGLVRGSKGVWEMKMGRLDERR